MNETTLKVKSGIAYASGVLNELRHRITGRTTEPIHDNQKSFLMDVLNLSLIDQKSELYRSWLVENTLGQTPKELAIKLLETTLRQITENLPANGQHYIASIMFALRNGKYDLLQQPDRIIVNLIENWMEAIQSD